MAGPGTGGLPERRLDQTYTVTPTTVAPGGAAGIFRGRLVVISGSSTNGSNGLFVYSGTPAFGNLILSISAVAGTDQFGNPYPAGLNLSQGAISGSLITGSIGNSTIVGSTFTGGAVTESVITFDSGGGALLVYQTTTVSQTFTAAGATAPILAPAGVTSFDVSCWGAGYGGQGGTTNVASGAAGGGGEFAREPALAVTPGNSYSGNVGAGVAGGAVGGNGSPASTATTFAGDSVTVTANTPAVSQSGGASGSSDTIHFSGGSGGQGLAVSGLNRGGGGGGSSAGTSQAGNNGASATGQPGGLGGAAPAGGGKGGNGGTTPPTAGLPGAAPGGGGGGGQATTTTSTAGGAGAAGQIKVSYVTGRTLIASISPVAGTDASGNSFPAGIMGQIVAIQPGSVPQVPETWHNFPLAANFTVPAGGEVPAYRLAPDGLVEVKGEVVFTSAGAGLVNGSAFTTAIPSGYWPTIRKLVTANIHGGTGNPVMIANNTPFVTVSAAGVLTLNGVTSTAAAGDTAFFAFWGRYSLTNP